MLAVCKVHAVGIMHNMLLNLRHFVTKGRKVFVDFALAMVRQCENTHPDL
jgi:tRNA A-37 threonylcarbamoyl transferase component Bud32